MNDKIGNVSFYDSKQSEYSFTKPYSDATAQLIDQEVKKLIDGAYNRAKQLLTDKRDKLEIIAKELLEKEVIFQSDLERLIGKRPFDEETTYQKFTNGKVEPKESEEEEKETIENLKNDVKSEVEEEDSEKSDDKLKEEKEAQD